VRSNRQNRPAGRPNNEVRPTDGTHANFPYSAELHEVPTHVSLRLERVRGQIGDSGIERISTQTLFDHLEVFQRSRGGGACRRLAQVMRARVDTCSSARPDARWIQGASTRILPGASMSTAF
jgi:hypothetical protein